LGHGTRVLEIGPGTGQATVRLVELGARVVAVELGAGLAGRLRERTEGMPVEVVVGDFDMVDVPGGPFDLAVSATAFHWLDRAVALPKIWRLLRPGGWLALWWTAFGNPAHPSAAADAIGAVCDRYYDQSDLSMPYVLDTDTRAAEIAEGSLFEVVHADVIDWSMTHSAEELRRLFLTHSPVQALEPGRRLAMLDDLEAMVRDQFGGRVTRHYLSPMYLARRRQ
jgi:SAM-dependent methyltransferase